jgi:thiol:disulfide interchange protein
MVFALCCVLIAISGTFLAGDPLPWEDFSTARLEDAKLEGRTILVDFTADW